MELTWFCSFSFHKQQVYSWSIADELLQQRRDLHSCLFAAQTIRNKIQNSFHELHSNDHVPLRDSLIAHIGQITIDTSPMIVTQLCLALADLALLMSEWVDPVTALIERLSGNENSLWPLINVITLIPEEVSSRHLRLGANRRDEIENQLRANSKMVLQLLVPSLTDYSQNNPIKVMHVLKCYTSWICIHAIDVREPSTNVIILKSLGILSDHDTDNKLHDAASDLLCAFLQCLEALDDCPVIDSEMFTNIGQLKDAYNMSVANEDIDKVMNYCRLFSQLAESFLDKILRSDPRQQPHYALKSLDMVLHCIGHYDYEVAALTFPLWYRLSEELYQKNQDVLSVHFQPYIERLLTGLYRLSQIEPDHPGLLDVNEEFMVSFHSHSFLHSTTIQRH